MPDVNNAVALVRRRKVTVTLIQDSNAGHLFFHFIMDMNVM